MTDSQAPIPLTPGDEKLAPLEASWQALRQEGYSEAGRTRFADQATQLADAVPVLLEALPATDAERPSLALVRGLHHARRANRARGTSTVDSLTDADWRLISENLAAAEPLLRRAIEADFGPGMALASLMRAEQIQGSRTAAERLFEEVVRREPQWLPAWFSILGVREPRWGGAVKDMDALLRLAEDHLTPADRLSLAAQYWWWRGNYTSTWEADPDQGLALIDRGLALPLAGDDRAKLLYEKGAILSRQDRDVEAVAVTREAVSLQRTADGLLQLGRRSRWAGDGWGAAGAWQEGAALADEDALVCARSLGDLFCYNAENEGVPHDRNRAVAAYERGLVLADEDEDRADLLNRIGLEWSRADPMDIGKAETAFQAAMALGNAYGGSNLARMFENAFPEPSAAEHERINTGWRFAAENGNVHAMHRLAERLSQGKGEEASPEEAGRRRDDAARHGSLPMLRRIAGEHREAGDQARAGVAAWLAGCEEPTGEAFCLADLLDHLAGGTFDRPRQDIALAMIRSTGLKDADLDQALRLRKHVLDYNARTPAERDPGALTSELKRLRRELHRLQRHADKPGGDLVEKAAIQVALHRMKPLGPEIEALLGQLRPGRRTDFLWDWFGGPLGGFLRPRPSPANRPELRLGPLG